MGDYPAGLILIVTGSTLRAEQMDRPLAYFLQDQIDKLDTARDDRLAIVISDRHYLCHPDLHPLPLISVGGPGVNRVARKLLKQLPAVLACEGKFFLQMDPCSRDHRASIWGLDNPQTRVAVATFAERFLERFAKASWSRKT